MLEIKGKVTTAICYAKIIEDEAIEQIRRMCDYFGYKVVNLKRIRVMNVRLGDMRPGELRPLTSKEESELRRLVGKN